MDLSSYWTEIRRSREFEHDVRRRVAEYFAVAGGSRHGDAGMVLKSLVLGTAYFGSYALLLTGQLPWPAAWLTCVVMGLGLAGLGFCVAHDALHGAYASNPAINRLLGFAFECLGGNGYAWRLSHNGAHHSLPNVSGHDEDVDVTPAIRLSPHSPHKAIHRHQHLFAFGLYALATLNWAFVRDYVYFLRRRPDDPVRSGADWARLLIGKACFYLAMAAPFVVIASPAWEIVVGLLTMQLTAGLTLGIVFQLAHTVESVEHSAASKMPLAKAAWAAHQLRTTCNFATRNRVLSWYVGGLNHQIEHHLFPRVCHVHYPRIRQIVEAAAQRHGLPYNHIPGFCEAIGSHYRMLRKLGQAPRPDAIGRRAEETSAPC
jgi:linoleoyl-CoA desaturase